MFRDSLTLGHEETGVESGEWGTSEWGRCARRTGKELE